MNRDEIIRMAREAGAEIYGPNGFQNICVNGKEADEFIERFAALVAAAEREQCAAVCDRGSESMSGKLHRAGAARCAAAIRARGNGGEK